VCVGGVLACLLACLLAFSGAKMGDLTVTVLEARKLAGQGNPVTTFVVLDSRENESSSKRKTKMKKRAEGDPQWNETFNEKVTDANGSLGFQVWGVEGKEIDNLGHAQVFLQNIPGDGSTQDLWLSLEDADSGQLHVSVVWKSSVKPSGGGAPAASRAAAAPPAAGSGPIDRYFFEVDRKVAQTLLESCKRKVYLVRPSSSGKNKYALTRYEHGKSASEAIYNLLIDGSSGRFKLENSPDENVYSSLEELLTKSSVLKGFDPAGKHVTPDVLAANGVS